MHTSGCFIVDCGAEREIRSTGTAHILEGNNEGNND